MLQQLTPDELLTTTRSVRQRLDFSRPVEREVIEQCLAIAQQAPTPSNMQSWHFIVVTDPSKRAAIAEIYRKGWEAYLPLPFSIPNLKFDGPERNATQGRVLTSAQYLVDHMHEVPVHVIPCITPRADKQTTFIQSALWGSIAQASWSFMLAARARGLGTVFTDVHLSFEEEMAKVLGIPYADIMQAALIPVAYTRGRRFRPAPRDPLHTMVHWEGW
jgi:nitroreductase